MGLSPEFLSEGQSCEPEAVPGDQRLPVELIEEILLTAWCPPCTFYLRRSFISFFLVNRLWASLMKRIVLQYVRLDSLRALFWYDVLYYRYQARIPTTKPIPHDDHNPGIDSPTPEDPQNPRDLCKDLMISTLDIPIGGIIMDREFQRIIPCCSQLERVQLIFGTTTIIEPSIVANTLLQLPKLTDLHITALASQPMFGPRILLVDSSLQLTQIRSLTLNVQDPRFTAAFIGICPALRSITLESPVEVLEGLCSHIRRYRRASPKWKAGECQIIVRPIFDSRNRALHARAGSCIARLKDLVPMLP